MMNNPLQLFQMLSGSGNPMQMMMEMLGNNPMLNQAYQMVNGKSPEQIRTVINNVANQKGISKQQLQQMASQFGVSL